MTNDIETLIKKISNLVAALEKTNNPTVNFYNIVVTEIKNCGSEDELKIVLDERLIHAGKIKDYGGYNREQCNLFNEMWEVANSIYEKHEKWYWWTNTKNKMERCQVTFVLLKSGTWHFFLFEPGSGVYSDVYIGGKVRIPFPGKDYDIHSGIQSNILFREDSIWTDGRGANFLVIPEIGIGIYTYKIPHGETPSVSTSWGYRNTISADHIRTKEGGSGFGYTVGISTAPATILPTNVSVSIPEKNK